MVSVSLRPIEPPDHAYVLDLNARHVDLLSPLGQHRLDTLLGWAHQALVAEVDGARAGFVLTFAPGTPYDSRWYAEHSRRFDAFTYLDRVVVDDAFRRRGVATAVYDALEATADRRIALEVNLEPPNEPSLAFHRARGYADLAELADGATKRVLLMAKECAPVRPGAREPGDDLG